MSVHKARASLALSLCLLWGKVPHSRGPATREEVTSNLKYYVMSRGASRTEGTVAVLWALLHFRKQPTRLLSCFEKDYWMNT